MRRTTPGHPPDVEKHKKKPPPKNHNLKGFPTLASTVRLLSKKESLEAPAASIHIAVQKGRKIPFNLSLLVCGQQSFCEYVSVD